MKSEEECKKCSIEGEDDEQCLKRIRKCEKHEGCCFSRVMENICSFARWYKEGGYESL